MAGVQRGGRGEVECKREARSLGSRRECLQGRYCFLRFLRPPDERKNPDWSELSFCSVLSDISRLSIYVISIYTAGVRRSLLLTTPSRNISFIGREKRFKNIRVICVAKNKCFERNDLQAVLPTGYGKV